MLRTVSNMDPEMRQLGTRFRVSERTNKSPGSITDTSGVKRPARVGMSLAQAKMAESQSSTSAQIVCMRAKEARIPRPD